VRRLTVGAGEAIRLFVPGRVCLFGEHSDWASEFGRHNGYCLVIGTDQGLWGSAAADAELAIETVTPGPDGRESDRRLRVRRPWTPEAVDAMARDRREFFRHCAGVAHELMRRGVPGGLRLRIDRMDLPLKKGLSSSAAVSVLTASAFDRVYDLGLFPHELMELAYRGERLTGSQCGRMDQACIFGKTPVLLTFSGKAQVRVEPIFPRGTAHLLLVDLAGEKDTVRILADLRGAYEHSDSLRDALGAGNERIVRQATRALTAGDAEGLGALMTEAQRRFDLDVRPHCASQLDSPLLHALLAEPALAELTFGGKGVGSQGDGTAQFVARSEQARDQAVARIGERFPRMRCFPLSILPIAGPGRLAGEDSSCVG
jgi:galactokinase